MGKKFQFGLFVLTLIALTACAQEPESHPNAWIDYPRDGDSFSVGTKVTIISHAFASDGVAEVVLSVNGEAYRRDVPADAGRDFVSAQQDWVPVEPGLYTLQVRAYDKRGNPGNPAVISVEAMGGVSEELPTPVDTATPVEAVTAVATVTLVPSVTPLNTATFPPPPPTASEPPPPPSDTTPPPVPSPAVPANGLELSCRSSQTLVWLPVDDPSGISGYYVKLEREVTPGNWGSVGGYGPVSGKQVDVNVDCGIRYRWIVRARDGAGNDSNWSAPSSFSVSLN